VSLALHFRGGLFGLGDYILFTKSDAQEETPFTPVPPAFLKERLKNNRGVRGHGGGKVSSQFFLKFCRLDAGLTSFSLIPLE